MRGSSGTIKLGLSRSSDGAFYRGGTGAYCTVGIKGVTHELYADASVAVVPPLQPSALLKDGYCTFPISSLIVHGGASFAADDAQLVFGLYFPTAPAALKASGYVSSDGWLQRAYSIDRPFTTKPLPRSTSLAAVTAFTPKGMYVPQRSFLFDGNTTLAAYDYFAFPRELPSLPDKARPHPRPAPRRLHAVAASPASSPRSTTLKASMSGQLSFWFGGIRQLTPSSSPSHVANLLNDLWVFDALANTTTLLAGDPSSVNMGARVYASMTYNPYNVPAARHSAALAYDSVQRMLWLYGGAKHELINSAASVYTLFDDLWSFDLLRGQWAWHSGNYDGVTRPGFAQAFSARPLPLAGVAMAAHNGWLLLYGGLGCASKSQNDTKYNALVEAEHLFSYETGTGNWTRLQGSTNTFDNTLPTRGNSVHPAARAYGQLLWRNDAAAS